MEPAPSHEHMRTGVEILWEVDGRLSMSGCGHWLQTCHFETKVGKCLGPLLLELLVS